MVAKRENILIMLLSAYYCFSNVVHAIGLQNLCLGGKMYIC